MVLFVGHNPTAASLAHLLDDGDAEPEAFREMSTGFPTSRRSRCSTSTWRGPSSTPVSAA